MSKLKKLFLELVHNPPAEVVKAQQELLARADRRAELASNGIVPASLDVVVAGSGFLSLYYLGVQTVVSRIKGTKCERFSGASSGAQAPLELLLTGEAATLNSYLVHGYLCGDQWLGSAMLSADSHWKALGADMMEKHASELNKLDGKCFVSVTRWTRRGPKNHLYSQWSAMGPKLAAEAFYATGTALTKCDGYWCSDGGAPLNEPLFSDAPPGRGTLIVRPTRSGLPMRMACGYSFEQAIKAIELGQDDAVAMLLRDPPPAALGLYDQARTPDLPPDP